MGDCCHPRAINWVQCGKCYVWYHCICVGVTPRRDKLVDFQFYCCSSGQVDTKLLCCMRMSAMYMRLIFAGLTRLIVEGVTPADNACGVSGWVSTKNAAVTTEE